MGTKNGNSPAQPVMDESVCHGQHYGFTKREEMAMRFAASMVANSGGPFNIPLICEDANELADAMLQSWENEYE